MMVLPKLRMVAQLAQALGDRGVVGDNCTSLAERPGASPERRKSANVPVEPTGRCSSRDPCAWHAVIHEGQAV